MTPTRSLLVIAATIVTVGLLAGCTPTKAPVGLPTASPSSRGSDDAPSATPSQTPSETPSSTPTSTPTVPPQSRQSVLFTITATASATGGSNAKVHLKETVYAPTGSASATDLALLAKQCSDWKTNYPSAQFVTTSITSSLLAGSPAWPAAVVPVGMSAGEYTAWSGNFDNFESQCAAGVLKTLPGSVHGVLPIPATNPANASTGWARSSYGFFVAWDGDAGDIPPSNRVAISQCKITLGATAAANSYASKWPTHPQTSGGLGCEFGTQTF
jgi:hypothetical protein